MKHTFIYGLVDPRDGDVHYIGKSNNPDSRLRQHLKDETNPDKRAWLDSLIALGLQPSVTILEKVRRDEWQDAERRWIAQGRQCEWPLVNIKTGGEGATESNKPSLDFLKPYLPDELWSEFEKLDTDKKREICYGAALTALPYLKVSLKAIYGSSAKYDPDTEFNRVSHVACALVRNARSPSFDRLIEQAKAEAEIILPKVEAMVADENKFTR